MLNKNDLDQIYRSFRFNTPIRLGNHSISEYWAYSKHRNIILRADTKINCDIIETTDIIFRTGVPTTYIADEFDKCTFAFMYDSFSGKHDCTIHVAVQYDVKGVMRLLRSAYTVSDISADHLNINVCSRAQNKLTKFSEVLRDGIVFA